MSTVGWLALTALMLACGGKSSKVTPASSGQPDRFLLDRATESMAKKDWVKAREYYRQLVDNYPQSPLRPDAKLGIGDTYLNEKSTESLILGANEFREFLTFYPTNPKADQAQFRLAQTHVKQMKAPERDQSATKDALREFQAFFDRYPQSPLMPEVRKEWRDARDRLSEASFRVGVHYYRARWYPGAVDRFREVLRDDPEFSKRDGVYFYLADSLARTDRKAEALPYFDRLLTEFQQSEYVEEAKKRLELLNAPSKTP